MLRCGRRSIRVASVADVLEAGDVTSHSIPHGKLGGDRCTCRRLEPKVYSSTAQQRLRGGLGWANIEHSFTCLGVALFQSNLWNHLSMWSNYTMETSIGVIHVEAVAPGIASLWKTKKLLVVR